MAIIHFKKAFHTFVCRFLIINTFLVTLDTRTVSDCVTQIINVLLLYKSKQIFILIKNDSIFKKVPFPSKIFVRRYILEIFNFKF